MQAGTPASPPARTCVIRPSPARAHRMQVPTTGATAAGHVASHGRSSTRRSAVARTGTADRGRGASRRRGPPRQRDVDAEHDARRMRDHDDDLAYHRTPAMPCHAVPRRDFRLRTTVPAPGPVPCREHLTADKSTT